MKAIQYTSIWRKQNMLSADIKADCADSIMQAVEEGQGSCLVNSTQGSCTVSVSLDNMGKADVEVRNKKYLRRRYPNLEQWLAKELKDEWFWVEYEVCELQD